MMEGDKVIVDRARLEQLEKDSIKFKMQCETIRVVTSFKVNGKPEGFNEITYGGKDEKIAEIVDMANACAEGKEDMIARHDRLYMKIHTASFLKRLKYLFTKEL